MFGGWWAVDWSGVGVTGPRSPHSPAGEPRLVSVAVGGGPGEHTKPVRLLGGPGLNWHDATLKYGTDWFRHGPAQPEGARN